MAMKKAKRHTHARYSYTLIVSNFIIKGTAFITTKKRRRKHYLGQQDNWGRLLVIRLVLTELNISYFGFVNHNIVSSVMVMMMRLHLHLHFEHDYTK